MSNNAHFASLGKQTNEYTGLETFPAPDVSHVSFTTQEFTSLCPVTGQPDFCDVTISYEPGEWCVESKSLKLYLRTFRDKSMFVEKVAQVIRDDVVAAIKPRYCSVMIISNPRGGLTLSATSEYDEYEDGPDNTEETYVDPYVDMPVLPLVWENE